ncbi:hypothetical protein BDR22DRAFT_12069 [Usnea florida]
MVTGRRGNNSPSFHSHILPTVVKTFQSPRTNFSPISHTTLRLFTTTKTTTTMCQGTLQISSSCGHRHKFHPLTLCPSYSPTLHRCTGTLHTLHTTSTSTPALCARCASRVAANIVKERDLVVGELEREIGAIEGRLVLGVAGWWRGFGYVACVFERARVREAVRGWWGEREGELEELRRGHGGRVRDLREDGRRMIWGSLD